MTMTEAIRSEIKRLREQVKPTKLAEDIGLNKTTVWRYLSLVDTKKIPFEFIELLEEKGYIFPTKVFLEHFGGHNVARQPTR